MTLENPNVNPSHTWWSRPSGGREVLRVAMPLVLLLVDFWPPSL